MGNNDKKLLDDLRIKASRGDVDAQYELLDILGAKDSKKDMEEAVYWGEMAAQSGDSFYMLRLAWAYELTNNFEKSFEWYSKAAEKKEISAIYGLAEMYRYGKYVNKSIAKALELYHASSKYDGTPSSLECIATIYKNGEGLPVNPIKAFEYYKQAIEITGSNEGIKYMIQCSETGDTNAIKCLIKASESGNKIAYEYICKLNNIIISSKKKSSFFSSIINMIFKKSETNSTKTSPTKTTPAKTISNAHSSANTKSTERPPSKTVVPSLVTKPKINIPPPKTLAHNGYKSSFPGHIKNCCTCDYWGGERDADIYTKYAYTPTPSTKGQCKCQQAPSRKQQMPANMGVSCSFYKKWGQVTK